jgi:outer membrane protein, adhesin transport system
MIRNILVLFLLVTHIQAVELSTTSESDASLQDDPLFHIESENGLSLYQAILNAVESNPKIDASKQRVYQASQRVEEAYAGHLPTVDLSGNGGYETRSLTPDGTTTAVPQTSRFHYKKTELYLNIKENIWAGGAIENKVDEQKQRLASMMYDHQANLENVAIEMIQTYFDVVYGQIALKVNEKNMQDFTKVLDIMKIKESNGAATKGDLNFIKANVDNAQTELIRTQTALSNALSFYTYLLGEQYSQKLPYEDTIPLQFSDLNTSLEKANTKNSRIQKQMANIQAAQYSLNAQKGTYHPTVDLLVNGESRDEFDEGVGQRDKASILLSFQYNLYNGGKDEATTLRLFSQMSEYRYTLADERRKISFQTKVLHQSLSALNRSIKLTESEVISARKVVNSYWVAFKEGTQDLQALQLALRNLNRAELDYVSFRKNLYVDNLKLLQSTGELLSFLDINYDREPEDYNEAQKDIWEEY